MDKTPLRTSPAEIMRWLGVAALHNSDNLKPMKDDDAARNLRMWWRLMQERAAKFNAGGPPDAA